MRFRARINWRASANAAARVRSQQPPVHMPLPTRAHPHVCRWTATTDEHHFGLAIERQWRACLHVYEQRHGFSEQPVCFPAPPCAMLNPSRLLALSALVLRLGIAPAGCVSRRLTLSARVWLRRPMLGGALLPRHRSPPRYVGVFLSHPCLLAIKMIKREI